MLITLRIQGATVEQIRLPSAFGGTRAILDHSEFATDLAFKHVVRDDQFDHALDVLNQEAMQWQRQRLKTLVNDLSAPDVHGLDLLTELLLCGVAVFERSAPDIAQDPQWPLSDVACVPTGQGRKLSAAEIFQGKGWWISDRVPSPLPPEITSKILILPPHLSQTWERWLGDAVTGSTSELLDIAERTKRLSRPRVEPSLPPDVPSPQAFIYKGVSGLVGRPTRPKDPGAPAPPGHRDWIALPRSQPRFTACLEVPISTSPRAMTT